MSEELRNIMEMSGDDTSCDSDEELESWAKRRRQLEAALIACGVDEEWVKDYEPDWLEDQGLDSSPLWEHVRCALDAYHWYCYDDKDDTDDDDWDWLQYASVEECAGPERDDRSDGGWCVSMFEIGRAYGGPEEGGWWYDYGIPMHNNPRPRLVLRFTNELEADECCYRWNKLIESFGLNDGRRPMSSVIGDDHIRAVVSCGPEPLAYPENQPHWE